MTFMQEEVQGQDVALEALLRKVVLPQTKFNLPVATCHIPGASGTGT
jgi:hypothetical protein